MLRDIIRQSVKTFREKAAGQVELQELFNRHNVRVKKTMEYTAEDHANLTTWSYRFYFDNQARKRSFLRTIAEYPPQEWDIYVRWMDDFSNFNGEFTVEAHCRVPPDKVGKFRYQFEDYISNKLILKD